MLKRILRVNKPGFSLIELVITCSIIALLALISIPIYTKYRLRSKVSTMISAASGAQFAVANDYFNQGYTFANTNFASGSQPFLVPSSNFISSITVENGWVRVTGDPDYLNGNQIDIVFQPTVENNSVTWTCYIGSAYFEYAPESCRNQGCAVYSWGDWTSIDSGTTWLYNGNPANVESTWATYCASYPWFFGCTCYNATGTNLVEYNLETTVIDNVDNGWGWTYLIVNFDCQKRTRELNVIGSCGSCPGGSVCQDMFDPLNP